MKGVVGRQDYVCSASSHTKLVLEHNSNKKTLMHISCLVQLWA